MIKVRDTVSVIVVTFNSGSTIKKCLEQLTLPDNLEVILVDNNSNDNTIEEAKQFPEIKLVQNKENLGFGKANNIGADSSSGEYIFFLNPDCVIEKETIEKLANFLDQNKDVAVVGPKLVNQDGSLQREMSPFPTLSSEILVLLRLHRLPFLENIVYPDYDYQKTQSAAHLMGSALMIRRAVFEKVGGFDPDFFLWFEETDLLKRIKDAEFKIVYYPEAQVTHLIGQSTKQLNNLKKQTIWNKSLLTYFKKHKEWFKLVLLLPFIILSYPAALVSYLVKR